MHKLISCVPLPTYIYQYLFSEIQSSVTVGYYA